MQWLWTNTTATPLDVVYSFVPYDAIGCIGEAFTVTVTVNPEPEVTDQSTTICSASTVGLTLADDVDGPSVASYDLTSITPEAGLSADASNAVLGTNLASDAIASDVWTNTTATPLDVVYSFYASIIGQLYRRSLYSDCYRKSRARGYRPEHYYL